jgi:acetate kinase
MLSPTNIAKSNLDFSYKLSQDNNHIVSIKQLYLKTYTATYFKYHHNTSAKKAYQFGIPHKLIDKLKVDKMGVIHLSYNYA